MKTRVVHGKIISDGNCFIHALEYALRNCDVYATRPGLYNKTRREVATFAIEKLREQEPELLAEFKEVPRNDEEIARFYQTFEERLDFLERFKTNKEYSNEDIIQYAALLKNKILCIVEEEGDHRVSLICPDIPFTPNNVLFLVHSNGNHYNTFEYPIHVSMELIRALKNLKVETVSSEYTLTMKDFTLKQLLSLLLKNRMNRRKTNNLKLAQSLAKGANQAYLLEKAKSNTLRSRKNQNVARTLAKGTNQQKLLNQHKTRKTSSSNRITRPPRLVG